MEGSLLGLLQSSLLQDTIFGALFHVGIHGVHGDGHNSGLLRMLEMGMAAGLSDLYPPIFANEAQNVSCFHEIVVQFIFHEFIV